MSIALTPGTIVNDGLVEALLLTRVTTKLGPAWRALILSGHQRGNLSLIFDDLVRNTRPYQAC